jgi:two-component system, chemotaxis family, CheB/CheR fusion protein
MSDTKNPNEADSGETSDSEPIGTETEHHFPIVAIGASAGGLEAFGGFFAKMPADSGMAFILIQHLDPTHKSMLPELVARFTGMPVHEITDGMVVIRNNVYVIPPDRDLGILHGTLHLFEPPERRGLRHPIDTFFRSLALDQGATAIAIVVSGTGTEGTVGLRDIKEAGGFVLVQDPESAKYNGMPRSAISTGLVDLIVPIGEMPENLLAMVGKSDKPIPRQPVEPEAESSELLKKVLLLLRAKCGHDFWHYKRNTIVRRIDRRMVVHRLARLSDYLRLLQQYPQELDTLFRELLIGVTRCFRDTEAFAALKDTVIPALVDGREANDEVRVWVPACSTGEEAVSIAILLHERLALTRQRTKIQVFATDIDSRAISIARGGFYPASISVDIPSELLQRYFVCENGGYRLGKIIRDSIVYAEQNMIKDPPFSRLDLISCRNVLIYMGSDLQKRLMPLFHYALKPDGFLFLGTSETIGDIPDLFSVIDRKMKIFRRKGGVPSALPNLTIGSTLAYKPVQFEEKSMETPALPINQPILLEKLLHAEFTPSAVLVNRQSEIQSIHGRTGKFLEPASGTATQNILAMAREGLKVHLASALRRAFELNSAVPNADIICPNLRVRTNGSFQPINLRVRLLCSPPALQGLALVVFEEIATDPIPIAADSDSAISGDNDVRIRELEQELKGSRDYLKTTVEELETANEELKSSNEELQSTNEELQSINEEHETSKEELQSVNEELVTVNCELESKVCELANSNNDMINLLASTEIATLFLDRNLSIKRFTPEVVKIFSLIQTDIGRPLRDIAGKTDYQGLVEDAREVLRTLISRTKDTCTQEGRHYKVRILPYRTTDNVIDGVVITFIDNSDQKALEIKSRLATVVRDSNDAVTVMDLEGSLLAWNKGAEKTYGLSETNTVGLSVFAIFADRQHDEIMRLLKRIASGEKVEPFQTERELRGGRKHRVQVTASLLRDEQGRPQAVATTEREVPEIQPSSYDAIRLVMGLPMPVIIEDCEGKVIILNEAATHFFGGGNDKTLIGLPSVSLIPPDDVIETRKLLERIRVGEVISRIPGRRMHGDGTVRSVVLSFVLIAEHNGAVATIIEVTTTATI